MKKMLINATQPEELRIALVEGNRLYDLVLDNAALERQRNNIYRGVVKSVEPSLGAVFVEYGSQRHGFMPLRAISHESFSKPPADPQNVKIEEAIRAGDPLLVQVEKDERDTKGAALTTFIKLTGHHITLTPNDPRAGRLPKQMSDAEHRAALDAIKQLGIPDGMGYIVRSPDIVERPDDLRRDLERLLGTWKSIQAAYQERRSPQLLYKEEGSVMCALRDYVVRDDIDEVWIDDIAVFKNATEYAGRAMPEKVDKIKLYEDTVPLFSYYQIERQIETAFQHEVPLPAGGRLVIDHTEALVSVDVNSARSTSASDIEQTALDTNLEAGAAVALQLRLRDIGGLIVIDFIDMKSKAHGAKVEETLRRALSKDHANIQVGHLSRFGLLEMSRQRIRPSLLETSSQVCSRCGGRGTVRRIRSVALTVFRIIHETAQKEQTSEIRVQVSPEVAAWLLNEKRGEINAIEQHNNLRLLVLPNPGLESSQFEISRLRAQDKEARDAVDSYDVLKASVDEVAELRLKERNAEYDQPNHQQRQAAVRGESMETRASINGSQRKGARRAASASPGWLSGLRDLFTRAEPEPGKRPDAVASPPERDEANTDKQRGNRRPQSRSGQAARASGSEARAPRGRGANQRRRGGSRGAGQAPGSGTRRRVDGKSDDKATSSAGDGRSTRSAGDGRSTRSAGDGRSRRSAGDGRSRRSAGDGRSTSAGDGGSTSAGDGGSTAGDIGQRRQGDIGQRRQGRHRPATARQGARTRGLGQRRRDDIGQRRRDDIGQRRQGDALGNDEWRSTTGRGRKRQRDGARPQRGGAWRGREKRRLASHAADTLGQRRQGDALDQRRQGDALGNDEWRSTTGRGRKRQRDGARPQRGGAWRGREKRRPRKRPGQKRRLASRAADTRGRGNQWRQRRRGPTFGVAA